MDRGSSYPSIFRGARSSSPLSLGERLLLCESAVSCISTSFRVWYWFLSGMVGFSAFLIRSVGVVLLGAWAAGFVGFVLDVKRSVCVGFWTWSFLPARSVWDPVVQTTGLSRVSQVQSVWHSTDLVKNLCNFSIAKGGYRRHGKIYHPPCLCEIARNNSFWPQMLPALVLEVLYLRKHLLDVVSNCMRVQQRELLGAVHSVLHFRHYLEGRHFQLYTDHAALIPLLTKKDNKHRWARWALDIQQFSFTTHVAGKSIFMNGPDTLSRYSVQMLLPCPDVTTLTNQA